MSGKHIELFLVDGNPGGLVTAEIIGWTGSVLTAPRSAMHELIERDEVKRTGVYLLLGDDEQVIDRVRCYIGEADDVAGRLKDHLRNKSNWDRVVVITSKDANLTKAHARYLESELIRLAKQAGRVALENNTAPPAPRLPEAHKSDMEYLIEQLQIVLAVLGINAIRGKDTAFNSTSAESPIFQLVIQERGLHAQAQQIDGEIILLAGSTVSAEVRQSEKHSEATARQYQGYQDQLNRFVASGSIVIEDGIGRVTQNIPFDSPSRAAAIVTGGACNGRTAWVGPEGTFGQWEMRGVP